MNRWSSYIGFSFPSAVDWESRLPCVLGTRKSRLSLFTREQQKLLDKAREMEGIPDLSALLRGKLQMISSSAGTSEVRPTRADGDADSEPPARSPPKERATKSKKQSPEEQPSTLERNVPLEMAPSSADASEVAAKKKKKKKDGKKRSREETFMEPAGTSAAMGSDDIGRLDPIDSTRGSSEGCPKKKTRRTAAGDEGRCDGTPVPEGPSKSGGGSQDGSPSSKRAPSSAARGKDGESGDITSAPPERMVVPEGTPTEERPDGNDLKATGDAIQADTGNVAAEDPVLVSSSEEREEDEVGEEENRSSPALIKETVRDLSASDPPAQVEDLDAQAVEEETAEPLAPSRDDQDIVV
ncbi:hypothetical protein HID58_074726 [Brassica napus]|uniref:Uncharacterized protein n=1 Tax=Brassica napus TaxID=3708 RepID=A0ABQ7YIX0_BRANA|nr:hypothetical protein HID58_074726 [Brassica napus]